MNRQRVRPLLFLAGCLLVGGIGYQVAFAEDGSPGRPLDTVASQPSLPADVQAAKDALLADAQTLDARDQLAQTQPEPAILDETGTAEAIAEARAAAVQLIVADCLIEAVGVGVDTPDAEKSARYASAREQVPRLVAQTWTSAAASEAIKLRQSDLDLMANDPRFVSYTDCRLEVTKWFGTHADAIDRAVVTLQGHRTFPARKSPVFVPRIGPDGWEIPLDQLITAELVRENGAWRLNLLAFQDAPGVGG